MCQVDVECLWGDYGVWSSMCFIKQDCWGGVGNDSIKFLEWTGCTQTLKALTQNAPRFVHNNASL